MMTLDGSGDGLSGIVSIVDEKGHWDRVKELCTYDSLNNSASAGITGVECTTVKNGRRHVRLHNENIFAIRTMGEYLNRWELCLKSLSGRLMCRA